MAKLIYTFFGMTVFCVLVYGAERSTDLSRYEGIFDKQFKAEELHKSLVIRGEIFLLDSTGTRVLYKLPEWREWSSKRENAPIESNWGVSSPKHAPFFLHHVWRIDDQGRISVTLKQYNSVTERGVNGGVKFGKLLKQKTLRIENFNPVVWISENEKEHRLVARLTPILVNEDKLGALDQLPISGRNMTVRDSKGNVWTERVNVRDRFVGFITHKGALLLSYTPFAGSQKLGKAKGKSILINSGKGLRVTISSETDFLPAGFSTVVYGIFRPELKTTHFGSTSVKSSSKEDEFLRSVDL